jgi:RNA polymerase sigma factor (sigma-70 family)
VINEKLLSDCKAKQRTAQRQLYDHMAPKLYYTCKRYLRQETEIEEVLADAFYTILTKLDQLKEAAAFEAWARKITVNLCLAVIRKRNGALVYLEDMKREPAHYSTWPTHLEEEDLLRLLQYLPEGCRTIFNLFVIEGYSHKEIAAMLQISEGTSKSQLNFSKTKLKELVQQFYYQKEN